LAAAGRGKEVVPASDYRALQNQVRELQRLLGKQTLEAEVLKEALEGKLFSGRGLEVQRGGIGPRQQVIDLGVKMAGDAAGQHVCEIGLRIHSAQFAGLDQ
jgi:hypothetical protein